MDRKINPIDKKTILELLRKLGLTDDEYREYNNAVVVNGYFDDKLRDFIIENKQSYPHLWDEIVLFQDPITMMRYHQWDWLIFNDVDAYVPCEQCGGVVWIDDCYNSPIYFNDSFYCDHCLRNDHNVQSKYVDYHINHPERIITFRDFESNVIESFGFKRRNCVTTTTRKLLADLMDKYDGDDIDVVFYDDYDGDTYAYTRHNR